MVFYLFEGVIGCKLYLLFRKDRKKHPKKLKPREKPKKIEKEIDKTKPNPNLIFGNYLVE